MADLVALTQPTEFLDFDTAAVRAFVARSVQDAAITPAAAAVKLYYAVRDGIRYEVYGADLSRSGLRASATVTRGSGFCLHKSVVYAAAVRSLGIPSRLVLTDVRNHLASPRLRELVGGDLFCHHCLAAVYLAGRWLKVTPVFNKALCHLFGMTPLEFDGRSDSLHHPYDDHGRRHMEFVRFHGEFDDLPYGRVVGDMRRAHPKLFAEPVRTREGVLAGEASMARG